VRWIEDNGTVRSVQNTLWGVPFHPEYKTWKQIGGTERIENNTIRLILGNDLAVKAIADNRLNPWPDGVMIGKVTWQEQPSPEGVVQPGQFVQVELMIRDQKKYRTTAGWGWGRWIGMDLKPDGQTLDFANTHCVDCHHAVERNDYVFTMPIKNQPRGPL
jgi:Cytochrome P460